MSYIVEREEHHHRPDARNQCDAIWINMVSFVSIFWYNLNGFLNVENVRQFNFFPARKAGDEPREVVNGRGSEEVSIVLSYRRSRGIGNTSRHISFEFLFIKTCPPDKLHNGFGFVVQFSVEIRNVICQGGKFCKN